MNKKNFILVGLVLVLAVVYAVYFTEWFRPKTIHISYTNRPARNVRVFRAGRAGRGAGPPNPARQPPSCFSAWETTTNSPKSRSSRSPRCKPTNSPNPIWHLVADPSSDSIESFCFTAKKSTGMDPAVAGARAEPLQPGVTYRHLRRRRKNQRPARFPHRPAAGQHGHQPVIAAG